MTVELRPLGVLCNLKCTYCYQNPQRVARNVSKKYDLDAMKAAVNAEGGPFTLFGGEPLLIPKSDLEELWSWGYVCWGRNSIQTNGVLIDDDHIRLFKKYEVAVGISIDGPSELNDARKSGGTASTRQATAKVVDHIKRLCAEHDAPSLIVTLHRLNAVGEPLTRLQEWLRELDQLGVNSVRLHTLEVDDEWSRANLVLTAQQNVEALLSFAKFEATLPKMRFDIFSDMRSELAGNDKHTTCIWNACDPMTTRAVRGVEGSGTRSNCGRTNKEGIDFVKAEQEGFERYLALYQTPQEHDGCNGCRFFLMCKGQCPGTAVDGDWRNRTEQCEVWMRLYEHLEQEMVDSGSTPLSLDSSRRIALEKSFLRTWESGQNAYIYQALKSDGQA